MKIVIQIIYRALYRRPSLQKPAVLRAMLVYCFVLLMVANQGMAQTGGSVIMDNNGQDRDQPSMPADYTIHINKERLLQLSDSLEARFIESYHRSRIEADLRGLDTDFISREGVRYSLQRFENGLPVYYRTRNAGAAVTSGVNTLYPGGSRKLFVTGKGVKAGVWDSGKVLADHVELKGRVVNVDTEKDFDEHATHVSGSMVAAGINPQVRGMAYEGSLRAFDWTNDLAEMAREAAAGMIISNHSYGITLGWDYRDGEWKWMGNTSAQEDARFGFYTSLSRSIDEVAFNAPHYLTVWAAGNDRSDTGDGTRPADGPYDTIGPEGVAKNVLTVGAINEIAGRYTQPEDAVMTAFSSWGPTDDGRIKPDVVTKGRQVLSTGLQNSYVTKSGTSMAAPIASGALMLVQQLYHDITRGEYLRAASLKGLAIHAANPTGSNSGPDYMFGWGLLDAGNMADILLNQDAAGVHFEESSLENGGTYTYNFFADGSQPIKATLSWADVPGPVLPLSLNPKDLKLVNDLDMRIVYQGGQTYFPWILDPENRQAEATTGDNFRDNVEKIWIGNPPPGNYQLVITHKNELSLQALDFSLFLEYQKIPENRTLYWVGGDGQWHDASKWSLVSGGVPAGLIPGENDHVIIDRLSFANNTQRLTLTQEARCFSFSMHKDTRGFVDLNGHPLQITTSLMADIPFVSREGLHNTIIFSGNKPYAFASMENFSEENAQDIDLIFEHAGGEWRLVSDFSAGRVVLKGGSLIFTDKHAAIRELVVEDNSTLKQLDMGTAKVSGLQHIAFPNSQFTFSGNQGIFEFQTGQEDDAGQANFFTANSLIGTLINHGILNIYGRLQTGRLDNHGAIRLYEDMTANEIHFTATAGFFLDDHARMFVGEVFQGAGEPDKLVSFAGTGMNTGIIGTSNQIFCLDYVSVTNLPFSGEGVFNAGEHSVVQQSPGWLAVACDDVWFADFSVKAACRDSWTLFADESKGEINAWDWQFSDLGTSVKQHPIFTFNALGSYPVRLSIEANGFRHSTEKMVNIVSNPLPEVNITAAGNLFFTNLTGFSYQWYRNGEPIPGATARSYNNAAEIDGRYVLLISNQNCNRPSANEVVVSVQEPTENEGGVKVYPNPATLQVTIESVVPLDQVSVFDLSGRLVYQSNPAASTLNIDTSGFVNGIYLVMTESSRGITYNKLYVSNGF